MDPLQRAAVALVLVLGCGPSVAASGPGKEPTNTGGGTPAPGPGAAAGLREIVVGEMCVDRAAGRPAVSAVVVRRSVGWSSSSDELENLIQRGTLQTFTVLSYIGKRAGTFTVAGPIEGEDAVALGAYAGTPVCEGGPADCQDATAGCGLAVAEVSPPGDGDPPAIEAGGACVQGDKLWIALDGQALSGFPVTAFLDPLRAPAEEVTGEVAASPPCEAKKFAARNLVPPGDPKAWRGLDLVGVTDLDGDGRREVVLEYTYGDGKRTWAVYSAGQIQTRLTLAAEGVPWGN
jgi:hypothetical protein